MGIFDGWRRKQKTEATVKIQESKTHKPADGRAIDTTSKNEQGDVSTLMADYNRLVQRREQLQVEREELIAKLDRGEIDADTFRKELRNRIQEAAIVSDNLRVTTGKLSALGYRGDFH